jgi:steroid delta-isomerase-like uncharacterized protein
MSTEQNKTLIRRWLEEVINANDGTAADTFMSADYVNHFMPPGQVGPEVERQILVLFFSAFPNLKGTLEDIVAEGDRVVTRIIWRGANTGSLMGIPPTGKQAAFSAINIFRIADGKIAENWPQVDMMGLMQQLGVVPVPGQS